MNRRAERHARQRRNRRFFTVLTALVLLIVGAATVIALRINPKAAASAEPAITIQPAGDAHYTPTPGAPIFVLAIGNDERPGVEGARGDALHLIGYNPTTHQGAILDFPRDTSVAIPGNGTNKINAANAFGGSKLTAETISKIVGVPISYIVEVNFAGFTGLINDMGGIEVDVPASMHDSDAGSNFEPGRVKMDGDQALSFSRDRHTFANGDFTRTVNQGLVLIGALRKLKAEANDPLGAFKAISLTEKHAKIVGMSTGELYNLLRLGLTVNPDQIKNVQVPVAMGSYEITPDAAALFEDFRTDGSLS